MSIEVARDYISISTSMGKVDLVDPQRPDTKTALEAGKNGTLVDAINKMAEYGYKLLEGTTLETEASLGGSSVTVFMYREK
jgi:hypothetical protein